MIKNIFFYKNKNEIVTSNIDNGASKRNEIT